MLAKLAEWICALPLTVRVIALLCCSNLFMLFAWYGHLKEMRTKPWLAAVIISWSIAFFEYLLMIPANRIGARQFSIPQLKIMQEVITLAVFVPFSIFFLKQEIKLDFLWAGLCLCGAVFFMFRHSFS